MPFDIRQLRYAVTAADHGSFYRAARALNVEQSTLSRSIIKLERAVGGTIFHRSRSGVVLTTAGAQFVRSARPLVANADEMMATMRAAGQGLAGGLTIGHYNAISAGHLRATILGWQSAYPDVELERIEADRRTLMAGLDRGEIDIVFLAGEANRDGFQHETFWSERIFIALPSSHPLSERELLHWTDVRCEEFVLPTSDPGSEIRDMLLGRLSTSGMRPKIRLHRTTRDSILGMLGGQSSLSVISEGGTGTLYPHVVYLPVHGEQGPALIIFSGYWRQENSNPAFKRFLNFTRSRFALRSNLRDSGQQIPSQSAF